MRVLTNTLSLLIEEWSDPGDYPSNAGSGPLPSYDYVAGVEGEVVVELDDDELTAHHECPEDFLNDLDIERPGGVLSWKLVVDKLEGHTMTLHAEDVEGDPDWGPDEPDYDPCD